MNFQVMVYKFQFLMNYSFVMFPPKNPSSQFQSIPDLSVTSRSQGSVTNGMKVTWYKDNSVLQEGNGITFSNSRTNLMISNPTSANEG